MELQLQHWSYTVDANKIAWLKFDRADVHVNSLNMDSLEELKIALNTMVDDHGIVGVIIYSGKKSGFIAGADVTQFKDIKTIEDAKRILSLGQEVFSLLQSYPMPTVAMIQGFCLGGGFELALACRYRVAELSENTRIGLPEVNLGLHPGWGGTVRLPQLIGSLKALPLIVSGRLVSAKEAFALHMIDAAVNVRYLHQAAEDFILREPPTKHAPWFNRLVDSTFGRKLFAKVLKSKISKKALKEHYPAPFAAVENYVARAPSHPDALFAELESIARLVLLPSSHALLRTFYLQEELKSLGKRSDFSPTHIHVIGAGTMGRDIAAWCVSKGFKVTLEDQKPEFLAKAIAQIAPFFKKKGRAPGKERQFWDSLIPDLHGDGRSQADVIIEAIPEVLELKQQLFQELENQAKPSALLASNTSTLPLPEIAEGLKNPGRLVGVHFFNPVTMMPLVEVIYSMQTSKISLQEAISFVKAIDKLPLPVKSSPGFLVNRILMPYLLMSVECLSEGISAESIDASAKAFGMPMGPVELSDRVGLDVCLHAGESILKHLGGEIPSLLRDKVNAKQLGVKTGEGFYRYLDGKPVKNRVKAVVNKELQARLLQPLFDEAQKCLQENITEGKDYIDAGMIFGSGFPPFRGGPLYYKEHENQY